LINRNQEFFKKTSNRSGCFYCIGVVFQKKFLIEIILNKNRFVLPINEFFILHFPLVEPSSVSIRTEDGNQSVGEKN